jgi:hypothetical protein
MRTAKLHAYRRTKKPEHDVQPRPHYGAAQQAADAVRGIRKPARPAVVDRTGLTGAYTLT